MADNKNENLQSQNVIAGTAPTQEEAVAQAREVSASKRDPTDVPEMTDPIIYRQDYKQEDIVNGRDPKKLANGGMNKNAYGDDGYSTNNADDPSLYGGTNSKYTGEGVKNTFEAYNPNLTTAQLDPTYKYGLDAEMANSQEANYIARRNDNIASALYNEGKTSMQDVADFLNSQEGFRNSYENERISTILSVWKRLGQIASENQQSNEQPTDPNKTPEQENNEALNNMESDLNKSTAGELYGKVTADQSTAIQTLEDENSVYKAMNAARIRAVSNLQAMDSQAIASDIISGNMANDSQAMRDLMQYDNAKYQEVKQAEKRIRGQMNINAITSGEGDYNTVATNGQSGINNEIADFALSHATYGTSVADILNSVNNGLRSNIAASSASETMDNLEADMIALQNRMKNLKKEANQVFKGDVPQYIVNAYIANRTAEIQDQLGILEQRYNSAQTRYQTELSNYRKAIEYNTTVQKMQDAKEMEMLNYYAKYLGIAVDPNGNRVNTITDATTSTSTTINGNTVQTTSLPREDISTIVDELVEKCKNGQLGNAQCAAGIQKNYLPYLGVNLGTLSKRSEKQGICNELAGEYTPQKGDLVVIDSGAKLKDGTPSGHIGMVVSIDGDTMTYLDWNGTVENGTGTETAEIRTKKLTDKSIYGYYNPTKPANHNEVAYGIRTRKDGTQFDVGKSMLFNSLSTEDKNTVLGLLNLSIDPATLQTRYGYDKGTAQKLLNAALEINPLWTDGDRKAALAAYQAWNKDVQQQGKSKNGTAISTAFEVIDLADKIGNGKRTDWNSMLNTFRKKLSNEEFIELNSNIHLLASEYAGALKGTASPTDKNTEEAQQIIASNFSKGGIKTAAESIIRALYNKNANEATNYAKVVLTKPNMLVTPEVADRMAELGLDMTIYGDYKGNLAGKKYAGGYAPKFGEETYDASSIGDLL